MGSVSNSLNSTANTVTNTTVTAGNSDTTGSANTTGIFTGTSAYSKGFQSMIDRAVAIASMPINLLAGQQTALNNQVAELNTIDTKFAALQTAVQGISTAMGGSSFQGASSQPLAVTATFDDGATEGIYNIQIVSPGSVATSLSKVTWNQPALVSGQTATYGLVIGNQQYNVTTSDNSAQGVASAIQAKYGSQVHAIAVNVGANSWRISLQGTTLGPQDLNLIQAPALQTQNTTGYAVSQTTSAWASAAGPYSLLVNGASYVLSPTDTSAAAVALAINSAATTNSLAVKASVVDLGSGDLRVQLAGTVAGSMKLDIQNGSSTSLQTQQIPATSRTTATWNNAADAPGTQSQYSLIIGGGTYSVVVGDNNAQTVAAAINTQFGTKVNATVVDLTGSGDYRIALQDMTGSKTALDIQKTTNLQTQSATGYAVSQTTSAWASAAGAYKLVVNGVSGTSYDLSPITNTAQGVADAINSLGLAVNAAVVHLGTGGNIDDRIQLEGTAAAVMTLGITIGAGPDLQTQQVPATSRTTATWNNTPDALNTRSQYGLVIGANTYSFVAGDNSVATVAAAINSQFGAMVNATVVDVTGSGDLRIALQDKSGTNATLGIQRTTANILQDQQNPGLLATYSLDGAAPATSNTASITVATGVTLNLLNATTGTASVTVTRSTTALSTALSTFTDAYNATVDEVFKQRGQAAGPLQGQPILYLFSQSLSAMSLYSSSGPIPTLENMGLKLETNGHITWNAGKFMVANFTSALGVTAFLGSATGGGFLKAATDALNYLEDPINGLVKTSETDLKTQITNIGNHISTKQTQVDQLQRVLTAQMAAADAAIASMEQQYSFLSSMFSAQQTASQMYR